MTNTLKTSGSERAPLRKAMEEESDFIDFYRVLGASPHATTRQLRQHITEIYADAQTNRDHRNLSKRLHYEALCELLPYARLVLLQPDKRARYDLYLKEYRNDSSQLPDFETIVKELVGRVAETPQELSDLLAIVEEPNGTSTSHSANQVSLLRDEPKVSAPEIKLTTDIKTDSDTSVNPITDSTPESPIDGSVDAQLTDTVDVAPVAPDVLDVTIDHEKSIKSEESRTQPIISTVYPEPPIVSTESDFINNSPSLPPTRGVNTTQIYLIVIVLFATVTGLLIVVPR